MKFIILGSGGASPSPRPTCQCRVCVSGRKGNKDNRSGPCLYLEDSAILFDTPEEARTRLNEENIPEIKHVFYTHWHPDHSQGMRIFEHMKKVQEGVFRGNAKGTKSTVVHVPRSVYDEFVKYTGKSGLDFFASKNFIALDILEDDERTVMGDVTVTPVPLPRHARYGYLIESKGKRVFYGPCSIYELSPRAELENLDICLLEMGWLGDTKKIRDETPKTDVRQWHMSFEENVALFKKIKPKRKILTHVEEAFGWPPEYINLKHDEMVELANKYGMEVAYDGMKLEV